MPAPMASPTRRPERSVERISSSDIGPSWRATKKPRPKPTRTECTRAVSQARAAASASAAALLDLLDHLEPEQRGTRRDRRPAIARRLRVPAREGRAVRPGAERLLALPPRVDEIARLALDRAEQLEGLEPGPGLPLGGAAGKALLELWAAPRRHLDGVDLDDAHVRRPSARR